MEKRNQSETGARARLRELAQNRRASLSGLSEMIGRNPAYLQQFVSRGSPRKLEEGDRRRLAEFFDVAESELGAEEEKSYNKVLGKRTPGSGSPRHVPAKRRRDGWSEIPRLQVGASAGPGAISGDEKAFDSFRFSERWLRENGLQADQLTTIIVQGDSMEPLLRDGDEILVDRSKRTFRDGIHVVRLDDTLMVKRLSAAGAGRMALLSQNMAYPPVEVATADLEIIGRVVWKSGRL